MNETQATGQCFPSTGSHYFENYQFCLLTQLNFLKFIHPQEKGGRHATTLALPVTEMEHGFQEFVFLLLIDMQLDK